MKVGLNARFSTHERQTLRLQLEAGLGDAELNEKVVYPCPPQAKSDIFQIWDRSAEDNPTNADKVRDRLFNAFDKLAGTPGIGHRREDLADRRHRFWP